MKFSRKLVVLSCLVLGLWKPAVAEQIEAAADRPIEQTITLLDSAGNVQALQPQVSAGTRVFVYLMGECPISQAYVPTLNRLHDTWRQAGGLVTLYAVWADVTTPPAGVAKFAAEHEVRFPILLDREGELARRFQPATVTEAFVLDTDGRLAYRGRIDDTYPELGRRRPEPTEHTLANAVEAVAAGQPVAQPRTEAVGCFYELPPEASAENAAVTYNRDIAPILFANCVVCHREGEVGPFPLATYEHAAKRAKQIARVVDQGLMPPWKAAQKHGEFEGQRTLTSHQIETIKRWAFGERAQGDAADLPQLPQFPSGWRLGEPDLVLEMQNDFELPADGPDIFQNFVIPVDLPEDKLVAVIDFVPGNPRVVHHSILYLDSNGAGRRLDAKTPEPGYTTFGGVGFAPTGSIGGWSPGKTPRPLPNGLGRYLKQGSDLVMQIHYHPSGKREVDRSKVGVYFVDKPKGVSVDIWASAFTHDIPPGEKDYRLNASYTLTNDVLLLGVIPHMHLLGRDMKATAVLPDGSQRLLIHVPDWNFNWQDDYRFTQPFKLPKGTRLDVEAVYDNSADNPSNPSSPPQRVTWGESTTNEMLYCFFSIATDDPKDLRPIVNDVLMKEVMGRASARMRR